MKKKVIIVSVALILIVATVAIAFAVTSTSDSIVVNVSTGTKTYVKIIKDADFKIADVDFVPAGGKVNSGVSELEIYKFSLESAQDCELVIKSITIDNGEVKMQDLIAIDVYEGERKLDDGEKLKANTSYTLKARWTVDRDSDAVTPDLVNKQVTVELEINAVSK